MVIIVGASGKLGSYLAEKIACDYEVIGTYYANKPIDVHKNINYYYVDVCNEKSVREFVCQIKDKIEKIILINTVGITEDGMGHKMSESTWDKIINTNLKGIFLVCREILPIMRKQEWGRIINISSIVGQKGVPGTIAYSSSKAGIHGLTRTLAAENASKNITVNALALGYFNIGIINSISPNIRETIKNEIPMRRFGDPKNLVQAVRFLIECDYVTGTTININGGLL